MRSFKVITTMLAVLATAGSAAVQGFDIFYHQRSVDFIKAKADGTSFIIVNPFLFFLINFSSVVREHYTRATNASLIRGGYQFTRPDSSCSATQANHFLAHGGGWPPDGRTVPAMVDLDYGSGGASCYGLSHPAESCAGNSAALSNKYPLIIAGSASSAGPLPAGWRFYTIWQYSDESPWGGDSDTLNGDMSQLKEKPSE
ncbi:glycoside hydrolase family 25 protein [Dactylonectria estremocensis]|uniref:Glycoside hydrolase family 25 protein n=1 Tax=Dactylonectria estremocensis TaxID=1079267 RepID=A0A9P9IBK7_9HYPO|nr:glycoside hydrolase family 25 protein [Dactylonectria estremocensis]